MSDANRTPSNENSGSSASSIVNLKRQQVRVKQVIKQLSSVSLPPGALADLRALDEGLEETIGQFQNDQVELLQLRALMKTWGSVNSTLDLNTVLTEAMNQVIDLTGAERGYILWRKPNTQELEYRIASSVENDPSDRSFQISNTIVNQVIQSGEPLLTDNASADERMDGSASIANYAIRSVLCVPLINRETTLGVVYVANRLRTGVFTQRELRLLTAFANQAVLAIDNARMFTRVKTDLQKAKGEVERLRIEINQGQAAKQVADITETEYFRHLATKAKELRQQKPDE